MTQFGFCQFAQGFQWVCTDPHTSISVVSGGELRIRVPMNWKQSFCFVYPTAFRKLLYTDLHIWIYWFSSTPKTFNRSDEVEKRNKVDVLWWLHLHFTSPFPGRRVFDWLVQTSRVLPLLIPLHLGDMHFFQQNDWAWWQLSWLRIDPNAIQVHEVDLWNETATSHSRTNTKR